MIQIRNFINGQWQEETGGKTVPLYNPSTGETIGSVPVSNMETCEAAIATAAEAYKTWRLVPIAKRMTYIHKIRECMIRDLEKLAQGIALDQAKHISEARGEVQRVIEIVEMACSIPALIQGETLESDRREHHRQGHETVPRRVRRRGALQLPRAGVRLVHPLRHRHGQHLHL